MIILINQRGQSGHGHLLRKKEQKNWKENLRRDRMKEIQLQKMYTQICHKMNIERNCWTIQKSTKSTRTGKGTWRATTIDEKDEIIREIETGEDI